MNILPNGTKVFILDKTIGQPFEETEIYRRGQNYGYIEGWKEERDCYVIRYDEGEELRGDYFAPSDITIALNKGQGEN